MQTLHITVKGESRDDDEDMLTWGNVLGPVERLLNLGASSGKQTIEQTVFHQGDTETLYFVVKWSLDESS